MQIVAWRDADKVNLSQVTVKVDYSRSDGRYVGVMHLDASLSSKRISIERRATKERWLHEEHSDMDSESQ